MSTCFSSPLTIEDRVKDFGPAAHERFKPYFTQAKFTEKASEIALLGFKQERVVDLYLRSKDTAWTFIRRYPICMMSGVSGPKLREGDYQVPEGMYDVSLLNPNSRFHVSLRLNYPNAFDRKKAALDGRTDLGGDIMIHGNCVSIGCLAMGDKVAEEIFTLSAEVGVRNISVVIAPYDFRTRTAEQHLTTSEKVSWLPELYALIRKELEQYPASEDREVES